MTDPRPPRLADPKTLTRLLDRFGLGPQKGLGQHFLISPLVVDTIAQAVEDCPGIFEIGPGPGVLTQALSESAERLIALEVDRRMATLLAESAPRAEVRFGDALETSLNPLLEELPRPRALVSNLPYFITAPLLQRIWEVRADFDRAVLMMQREVAERVLAPAESGERGSLSVYMQAGFAIRRLTDVPAGAFLPPPKVASTVLVLLPRREPPRPAFLRLVRLGFKQPRKTLANNLSAALGHPREAIQDALTSLDLSESVRAQDLTETQWIELSDTLEHIG